MGMFGEPEPKKTLVDVFPPGVPFRLLRGWLVGLTQTTTGTRMLAKIEAEPIEHEAPAQEFGVWGSLCEQVRALEAGELPAIVTLSDSSGVWRFEPHGPISQSVMQEDGSVVEQPMSAVPEAHLDLSGGVADPPGPVPPAARPVGTDIDESSASPAPALPPAARPKGTEIDESQVFQPGADHGQE